MATRRGDLLRCERNPGQFTLALRGTLYLFELSDDGLTRDAGVHEMVARLADLFPEIDPLALEAAMMLERTHTVLANMRQAYWSSFGLSGKRFALLRLLYLSGQRLTIGEIAAELDVGTNNISQLIDATVRDDLVRREVAEDDKRVVYAVLTEAGRNLFAAVFPQNTHRVEATWAPLSAHEKQLLIDFMTRIYVHYLKTTAD